jgi:hypothetical protein
MGMSRMLASLVKDDGSIAVPGLLAGAKKPTRAQRTTASTGRH